MHLYILTASSVTKKNTKDCKRMGKAMYDTYITYSNKSSLIIDHKIHLSEDKDFKMVVRDRLRIDTGIDFDNLTEVEEFACDISSMF